jgi:hypothetical protein
MISFLKYMKNFRKNYKIAPTADALNIHVSLG